MNENKFLRTNSISIRTQKSQRKHKEDSNQRPVSLDQTRFRPSCSLAEFNKAKEFNKQAQEILRVNQPLRITIPSFFNTPRREDASNAIIKPYGVTLEQQQLGQGTTTPFLTGLKGYEPDLVLPVTTKKRIRDLKMLGVAMHRAKNIKQEARSYYSAGILYENICNYKQAINYFQKFLRITLFLQDRRSIELVLNAIGLIHMILKDYKTAMQYHVKQAEISKTREKFIGIVNTALCLQKLKQYNQAFQNYQQAAKLAEEEGDLRRQNFIKESILFMEKTVPELDQQVKDMILQYQKTLNVSQQKEKVMKSYMRLGQLSAQKGDYSQSHLKYSKALQFGYLNEEPKRISQTKELLKKVKLGYAISTAENKMKIYLETYEQNLEKYRF